MVGNGAGRERRRARGKPSHRAARAYDAPLVDAQRVAAPELLLEYSSVEERGIKLVYHLRARERAHALLARALAVRAELGAELGRDVLPSVEIRVAASARADGQRSRRRELPAGAAAVAYRDLHLVVMSLSAPPREAGDLEDRLRHELAHLALDEAIAAHDVPRWFHEGYALHASGEDVSQRAEVLCEAALRDRLLRLRDVEAHFPDGPSEGSLAAAEAAELVRFLLDPAHRQRFPSLIEGLREGKPFEAAVSEAYEEDVWHIERRFRKEIARRYSFVPVLVGATVIWVAVALGVMLRRRRLAAQEVPAETQASSAEVWPSVAHARAPGPPVPGGGGRRPRPCDPAGPRGPQGGARRPLVYPSLMAPRRLLLSCSRGSRGGVRDQSRLRLAGHAAGPASVHRADLRR